MTVPLVFLLVATTNRIARGELDGGPEIPVPHRPANIRAGGVKCIHGVVHGCDKQQVDRSIMARDIADALQRGWLYTLPSTNRSNTFPKVDNETLD
jgi:hypothetical protein